MRSATVGRWVFTVVVAILLTEGILQGWFAALAVFLLCGSWYSPLSGAGLKHPVRQDAPLNIRSASAQGAWTMYRGNLRTPRRSHGEKEARMVTAAVSCVVIAIGSLFIAIRSPILAPVGVIVFFGCILAAIFLTVLVLLGR